MHVQEYLSRYPCPENALAALVDELGIRATLSETDPLVILNYDQIESPKFHPIVRECRGLTLELGSWDVVARSFERFFNLGENKEEDATFYWERFRAYEKCDGSLMVMYKYRDTWRVNTRGSFATGPMFDGGPTWEEMFWQLIDEVAVDQLPAETSYVFELCSPYNKVVRTYDQPQLFLLTAFDTLHDLECSDAWCDRVAQDIRVSRPQVYAVNGLDDIDHLIATSEDPTWEGVVIRDSSDHRIKVKNPTYVALHHLKGESSQQFHPRRMLSFVRKENNEWQELLNYFPECSEAFWLTSNTYHLTKAEVETVWEDCKGIEGQKDFALAVVPRTEFSSLLFEARKQGRHVLDVWKDRDVENGWLERRLV